MRRGFGRTHRGFIFLTVLMLLTVGVILLTAGLQRSTMRARLVEMQLEGYERHHELLGVRDTVFTWLQRIPEEEIQQVAASGQAAQRIELAEEVTLIMTVRDGQGTILLKDVEALPTEEDRAMYLNQLAVIPAESFDLHTRRVGPETISLHAASDEVLRAIGVSDPRLGEALIKARDEHVPDAQEFTRSLQQSGIQGAPINILPRLFVFTPKLWRFDIEVFHARDGFSRRYMVLAEISFLPIIHEWREIL